MAVDAPTYQQNFSVLVAVTRGILNAFWKLLWHQLSILSTDMNPLSELFASCKCLQFHGDCACVMQTSLFGFATTLKQRLVWIFVVFSLADPKLISVLHDICKHSRACKYHVSPSRRVLYLELEFLQAVCIALVWRRSGVEQNR